MAPEWLVRAFAAWGRGHARKLITRELDGLRVEGLERAREALARGPIVLAPNHVGWWDGVLMVALNEQLAAQGRVLMEPRQLRAFPWFRAYGALPLGQGEQAPAQLAAAASHLTRPGQAVWIFPQGRHTPLDQRPFGARRGVEDLATRAQVPVLPVCFAYHWLEAPSPAAFVRFEEPIAPGPGLLPALEAAWARGLGELSAALTARQTPGALVLAPQERSNPGAAVFAWIWRRFAGGGDG